MAKKTSGRKPDFKLKVLDKSNNRQGDIGAAWLNDDGSITLQINPGTVLLYDPSLYITLFPAEWKANPIANRRVFGGNADQPQPTDESNDKPY